MSKITFLYSHDDELAYKDHMEKMGHEVKSVRQCEEMPVDVPLDEFDCLVLSPTAKYEEMEVEIFSYPFSFNPYDVYLPTSMPEKKQETAEERKSRLLMEEISRAVKAYGASTVNLKSYKNDH